MLFPNKLFSYKQSIISKFPIVLNELEKKEYSVKDLYVERQKDFSSIKEYIEVLDCLYALGKIRLDTEREVLYYVV